MSEERLRVLEMLKEGKISSDEALELLKQIPEEDESRGNNHRDWDEWGSRPGQYTYTPDFSWIDDLRTVIKETTQNVMFPGDFLFGSKEERFYAESDMGNGIRALIFEGKNAPVKLEAYGGNKIEIEARYRVKAHLNPHLAIREEGGTLRLISDNNSLHSLSISVRVPEKAHIGFVNLKSTNASVTADDILADKIELDTKNAPIKVSDVKADTLHCSTRNAPITLDDVKAQSIEAQTTNSKITADDVETAHARLTTDNAKISVKDSNIAQLFVKTNNAPVAIENASFDSQEQDRQIDAKTSNGGITIRLPHGDFSCKLRASTTNGRISSELNDLEYRVNEKNYVEAATREYDQAQAKLNLNLQTSNGGIYIKR